VQIMSRTGYYPCVRVGGNLDWVSESGNP